MATSTSAFWLLRKKALLLRPPGVTLSAVRVVCVAVVGVLLLAGCGSDGNTASESAGDEPSLLYVQDADGGTLDGDQLTMVEVSPNTGWFTDRPAREAGQIATADFVRSWDERGTFSEDPPNADFTCETDGDTVNVVVELKSAVVNGRTLTYDVARIGDTPAGDFDCDGNAHLFIDNSNKCAAAKDGQLNLNNAFLRGCDLDGANMNFAALFHAFLADANLTGALLEYSDMNQADLRGANLSRADLSSAMMYDVDLHYANLTGVRGWDSVQGKDTIDGLDTATGVPGLSDAAPDTATAEPSSSKTPSPAPTSTPAPSTPAPSASESSTPAPSTPAPSASESSTPAPSASESSTPAPSISESSTPEPSTPAPSSTPSSTPESSTPEPSTSGT